MRIRTIYNVDPSLQVRTLRSRAVKQPSKATQESRAGMGLVPATLSVPIRSLCFTSGNPSAEATGPRELFRLEAESVQDLGEWWSTGVWMD